MATPHEKRQSYSMALLFNEEVEIQFTVFTCDPGLDANHEIVEELASKVQDILEDLGVAQCEDCGELFDADELVDCEADPDAMLCRVCADERDGSSADPR